MAKKKTRNRAKDVISDYYRTNRQVEKENEEARERQGEQKGWSRSEKIMLGIIIIGAIGLLFRYVILR